MTRLTFTRFATALAIGASVLATSGVANARGGGGGFHGGGMYAGGMQSYTSVPVHGPGSSHNPIVYHPKHGPGSSHNPIVNVIRDHRGPNGAPGGGVTVTSGFPRGSTVRDHRHQGYCGYGTYCHPYGR